MATLIEKQQNIRIAERLGLVKTQSKADLEKTAFDDDNKKRREMEQQNGKKILILTIVAAVLQIGFLIIMGKVNFKMFSIIPFFMAPIWVLLLEAIALIVVKLGRSDFPFH